MNGDNTEAMPGIEFAESRGRVSIPPETKFMKSITPSSFNFCVMVRFSDSDKPVFPDQVDHGKTIDNNEI